MRFHLQALAVAPIFLSIITAISHPLRSDLPPRDGELERREYGAPSQDLVHRALGGSLLSVERSLEARNPQVLPYRPKPRTDKKGKVK